MTTELIKLIEAFPKKQWNWNDISSNKNISFDYIDSHPEFPWVKSYQFGYQYGIFANPNLNINYVLQNFLYRNDVNWKAISKNSGITPEDIENNLTLPWDWNYVAQNPNITMEFILKHNITNTGLSPNITLEDIEKYPDLFKLKSLLSQNPNVTLDYILNHPDNNSHNKWDWISIGGNPNITFQDVLEHPELMTNQNISRQDQVERPWLANNMYFIWGLSSNPNITMDIIEKYPNLAWNETQVAQNPSITIDDLHSYKPKVNFNTWTSNLNKWNLMSLNPNLTADYVLENIDEDWDLNYMSMNRFNLHIFFNKPIVIRI